MTDQDVAAAVRTLCDVLAAQIVSPTRGQPMPVAARGVSDCEMLALAAHAVRLYAETHPRPTQVTQAQAAEMLGISRHTVSRMIAAGELSLNRCGLVPIEKVDAARSAL